MFLRSAVDDLPMDIRNLSAGDRLSVDDATLRDSSLLSTSTAAVTAAANERALISGIGVLEGPHSWSSSSLAAGAGHPDSSLHRLTMAPRYARTASECYGMTPRTLRTTTGARKSLAAKLARWAMTARALRKRRARAVQEAHEEQELADDADEGKVRRATGRSFAATADEVREQVIRAFSGLDRAGTGAGFPWPLSDGLVPPALFEGDAGPAPPAPGADGAPLSFRAHKPADAAADPLLLGLSPCPVAVLAPHGSIGGPSGEVAAWAYKALWDAGVAGLPRVVVCMGAFEPWQHSHGVLDDDGGGSYDQPAHEKGPPEWVRGKPQIVLCDEVWETPLGRIQPARALLAELQRRGYRVDNEMHRNSVAIEAQLPFLQSLVQSADGSEAEPIRIVPILVGNLSRNECDTLATEIAGIIASAVRPIGVIGCTNLGHRGPKYFSADGPSKQTVSVATSVEQDQGLCGALGSGVSEGKLTRFSKLSKRANMTGHACAATLLLIAHRLGLRHSRTLARQLSRDCSSNNVGHAAIAFEPASRGHSLSANPRASMERPEPLPLKRDLQKPKMLHRIGVATAYYDAPIEARSARAALLGAADSRVTSIKKGVLITIPGLPQDIAHHPAQAAVSSRPKRPSLAPEPEQQQQPLPSSTSGSEADSDRAATTAQGVLGQLLSGSGSEGGSGGGKLRTAIRKHRFKIAAMSAFSAGAHAALPHQRHQAAGPDGVYDKLVKLLVPQGWAVIRLAWPRWVAETLSAAEISQYASLACRDVGRYAAHELRHGPVSMVGWGSGAATAVEAAARLAWELPAGQVEVVATLSEPSTKVSEGALHLAGRPTLPYAKAACGRALGVLHAQMYGAEDYCPRSSGLDLSAALHSAAHVAGVASALSSAVGNRPPEVSKLRRLIQERVLTNSAVGAFLSGVQEPAPEFEPGIVDPISLPRWPSANRTMFGQTPNSTDGFGWTAHFRVRGLEDPRLIDNISGREKGDWAKRQLALMGEEQYVRIS